MEPTSEQELKQLLDEGRITEQEYHELLEALRQKEIVQKSVDVLQTPTGSTPRTGYGRAALILMIIGLLIPTVPFILGFLFHIGVVVLLVVSMILGGPCLLLAFIFGIIGWKSAQGKIAAIGVPCLGLLIVPGFIILSLLNVRAAHSSISEQLETLGLVCHKHYPLDSTTSVITRDGVEFDKISTDGNGSLRIKNDSSEKKVIRLFETGPFDIQSCMLIYSAKIRAEKLYGKAYLEMWCDIPGKGEFFSRSIEQPVTGSTVVWTTVQTPFRLEKGQMPANVKLNVVIDGAGTVWIDDIKLLSEPLI